MPSKVYSRALKGINYGVIQRGASFTLPVEVKDEEDNPINLGEQANNGIIDVEFTIKKVKTDFDRHDDKCYVRKTFLPQDPEHGKFYVCLSSDDTDFEPGKYYFDVELVNRANGMVFRLFTCEFTLDGGPTNRRVNKGMGQWPMGDTIHLIAISEGDPIVVVAPTLNLDGDVFGQLATLMDIVDSCEKHVAECEILDKQVQDEVAKLREDMADMNGQIGDHEDDLNEVFKHLEKHDDALKEILEALEAHMELIRQNGSKITRLVKKTRENTENIEKLTGRIDDLEKRFNQHWEG